MGCIMVFACCVIALLLVFYKTLVAGLQIHLVRFDSGSRLHFFPLIYLLAQPVSIFMRAGYFFAFRAQCPVLKTAFVVFWLPSCFENRGFDLMALGRIIRVILCVAYF
jgi:hypothetical protein